MTQTRRYHKLREKEESSLRELPVPASGRKYIAYNIYYVKLRTGCQITPIPFQKKTADTWGIRGLFDILDRAIYPVTFS